MRNKQKINKTTFFISILFLLSTSLLSLKTLKKVEAQNIKITGSKLFSEKDLVQNSSLNFSTRLIFIKTKQIEKELKKNLSLKNVSVIRQVLPFGLKVIIKTRIPIARGEQLFQGERILGFIDEDGLFINKKHTEIVPFEILPVKIFGWREQFKKTLSEILKSQKNGDFELIKITFSTNGSLTLEEKDLKIIFLGFNSNLIRSQLLVIKNLKNQLGGGDFSEKIDIIDLTDPENPKIKVFKP